MEESTERPTFTIDEFMTTYFGANKNKFLKCEKDEILMHLHFKSMDANPCPFLVRESKFENTHFLVDEKFMTNVDHNKITMCAQYIIDRPPSLIGNFVLKSESNCLQHVKMVKILIGGERVWKKEFDLPVGTSKCNIGVEGVLIPYAALPYEQVWIQVFTDFKNRNELFDAAISVQYDSIYIKHDLEDILLGGKIICEEYNSVIEEGTSTRIKYDFL